MLLRAARILDRSLLDFAETLPIPGEREAAIPNRDADVLVLRLSLGRVTLRTMPGLAVGDRWAVENPTQVDLGGGRTVEDWDRVAIVKVAEIGTDLSKAEIVEGDSGAILPGKSRLVRVPG